MIGDVTYLIFKMKGKNIKQLSHNGKMVTKKTESSILEI